jgi:hypothetical protein
VRWLRLSRLLASRLVASCDKSASILPRTVAKHISSERIVTPELAPDDHVGLIDSCDHTHSCERFPTSASVFAAEPPAGLAAGRLLQFVGSPTLEARATADHGQECARTHANCSAKHEPPEEPPDGTAGSQSLGVLSHHLGFGLPPAGGTQSALSVFDDAAHWSIQQRLCRSTAPLGARRLLRLVGRSRATSPDAIKKKEGVTHVRCSSTQREQPQVLRLDALRGGPGR